jgi:hypothetical protein
MSAANPNTWRPFTHNETVYDLSHLNSKTIIYEVAAKHDKPALSYTVDVAFSTHCFTAKPCHALYEKTLEYRDGRELRIFDLERYRLSKDLPTVVDTLVGRKCLFAGRDNFVTITFVDQAGKKVDYDIFFTLTRSSTRGRLNLFIQSAYVGATIPRSRTVRFEVILHNTLNKIPLHG